MINVIKKSVLSNSRGASLMVVIFLLPFMIAAVFVALNNWTFFFRKEKLVVLSSQARNIVNYLHYNLENIDYWTQTINHADNAGATKMDCVKNNTDCSAKTSFSLLDTLVTDQGPINLSNANLGFNTLDLDSCNTFDETNGHIDCVFKPRVYWRAICNNSACIRSSVEIRLELIYRGANPLPSSINTQKYEKQFMVGSQTSKNENIYIVRRYLYSDPANYSYASGSPPLALDLGISPAEAVRMEGPCSSASWVTRKLIDPNGIGDGIYTDEGQNVVSINASGSGHSFTLRPGGYYCTISAPAYSVGSHIIRLTSIPEGSVLLYGMPSIAGLGTTSRSKLNGFFVINQDTVLEVQHSCSAFVNAFDLGRPVSKPNGQFDMDFTIISCSLLQR